MIKKITTLALCILLIYPNSIYAYTIYEVSGSAIIQQPIYDPGADRYTAKFDPNVVMRIVFGSYTDETFNTPLTIKERTQTPTNRFVGDHHFYCNSYYKAEYFDENGNKVGTIKFNATQIKDPTCDSGTSFESGDNGSGGCVGCGIFNCPGWGQYMEKLEQIRGAIPPPPDWEQVAGTFRDIIVPKMIADMREMLGSAPSPTLSKPQPPPIDTGGIEYEIPRMNDVPGLKESTFSKDDLENQAKTIPFREDQTGGFDLMQNPIEALPDLPFDIPIPGKTNAGEWEKNKPRSEDIPFPNDPREGDIYIPTPPKPEDDPGQAPTPENDPGQAPTPGDDLTPPPSPQDEGWDGTRYYKNHPE